MCNNCGKQGHQYHQCKTPIISYGIILFRPSSKGIQYLMIRRKDSFGYIDFIRGKYALNNLDHTYIMFDEMSVSEKENILKSDFETLWKNMWSFQDTNQMLQYKNEEIASSKKFYMLKNGLQIGYDGETINTQMLIENSKTNWIETEWEFPKGRKNHQESDVDCALREFEEETGILKSELKIVDNLAPFEETFVGSNHKSYKHKYFLAYTDSVFESLDNYQQTEVSKMEWKTLDECLECIRPYNLEKKRILTNLNKILTEYSLL